MSAVYSITAFILAIFTTATKAAVASATDNDFKIFTCGALGGSYAREITSFFIAATTPKTEEYNFLSMDAGTSLDCIDVAAKLFDKVRTKDETAVSPLFNSAAQAADKFGPLGKKMAKKAVGGKQLGLTGYFRKKQLNGFLVTHAHSDHQTGLVISSAEDDFLQSRKAVIAPKNTVAGLNKQFKPPLWPGNFFYTFIERNPKDGEKSLHDIGQHNMATEGVKRRKGDGLKINHWAASKFYITPYFLSHETDESTAYRVCNGPIASATACVLFFGDTGPDDDELNGPAPFAPPPATKKQQWGAPKLAEFKAAAAKAAVDETKFLPLRHVWDDNIKYIQNGVLNTIFLECSYMDSRIKDNKKGLFGHLTPKLIVDELAYIGLEMEQKHDKRKNTVPLTVVVMHLKPTWNVIKNKATETANDGLSVLIEELKKELKDGVENTKYGTVKKYTVNDKVDVKFVFPVSQDMIYVKGGAESSQGQIPAVPGYAPKGRVAAPRGDYYKPDYSGGYHTNGYNHNNEGYGLFATEIVLVLALVCVVGLCFVVGLTFGGGVMWMAMIKKRKEKRTN